MLFTYDSWSHLTDPDNWASRRTAEQRGYSDPSHTGRNRGDTSAVLEKSQDVNVCR